MTFRNLARLVRYLSVSGYAMNLHACQANVWVLTPSSKQSSAGNNDEAVEFSLIDDDDDDDDVGL